MPRPLFFPATLVSVGLFFATTSQGQNLTIQEAAKRVLAHYPLVAAAQARRELTRRELGEATAQRFPSITSSATAVRYKEPMVVTPIHGFTPGRAPEFDDVLLQNVLTADWLLFDGFGRSGRIDQRRALLNAADEDLELVEQTLLASTIEAYLRVLGLSGTLAAHDRRLEALESEEDRVRQLRDTGRAPELEVRRVAAGVASARAERVRLAFALDVSERELAHFVAADASETRADRLVSVSLSDVALAPRTALLAEALGASPAVRAAVERTGAAEAAVRTARSAHWPSVRVVGIYTSYGDSEADFEHEWNAGLRLQVPLFTGGALTSRVGQTLAARAAAEAELELARMRLESELDRAVAALEEARARVTSLEVAAQQFAEVARIEKLRLDTESGTQTDYLEAEAERLVAEAQLVEAYLTEVASCVEIARLTGALDLSWIEEALEAGS